MSYPRLLAIVAALAGCAQAVPGAEVDAGVGVDGPRLIDAGPGPGIDAPRPVDAPTGCVTQQRDLLTNGSFDASPPGTGWTATPITAGDNLMGTNVVESAPTAAWLGGLTGADVTDVLFQDVTIPASTTALAFSGFYQVQTLEFIANMDDTATLTLTSTSNAVLETMLTVDEGGNDAWTPVTTTFAQTYAGQTIRVRMTSTNDGSYPTSFYFDTLALTATVCE